jgi:O-methyltransferase domain
VSILGGAPSSLGLMSSTPGPHPFPAAAGGPGHHGPANLSALAQQLSALMTGAWITQMVRVAAELDLAGHLAAGEQAVYALARACACDPESLFRLLRALAAVGLFQETAPRRFGLTPLADLLRADHPASMRSFARLMGDEHYLAWDDLLHCIRTGEPAFGQRFGDSLFDWYQQHPERAAIFDGAMGDISRGASGPLLDALPWAECRHLVDVGGGRGALLIRLLRAHPHLRGTVLDQPTVVEGLTSPADLAERFAYRGGDFFAEVPAGADTYLLKHILHDWGDDACAVLLERIATAMAPGARLLVIEQVIPPGNDPFPGKLLDLNMLVMTEGGRERTPEQYASLLARSGLHLQRIRPTASPLSVVEAVRA